MMPSILLRKGGLHYLILSTTFALLWGNAICNKPRYAPFCIDADETTEDLEYNSERFKSIIAKHNRNNDQPVEVFKPNVPNGYIEKISLSRMMVDDDILTSDHILRNLRNWLHITLLPSTDLAGLYMQAIKAPLGVPFGNFVIDFECKDCHAPEDITNAIPTAQVVPCKARPKCASRHPNVLVVAGDDISGSFLKDRGFHFHFNWIEAPCDDVPIFQFLIVAVKDFGTLPTSKPDYKIMYSPLYENEEADTWTGVPWPLDPTWKHNDSIVCHEKAKTHLFEEQLSIKVSARNATGIITMNKQYEDCITQNTMKPPYQCPPGPFSCDKSPPNKDDWISRRKTDITNTLKVCSACSNNDKGKTDKPNKTKRPPKPGGNKFRNKTHIDDLNSKFINSSKYLMKDILNIHAVLMVITWTLFSSVGSYIARFHKESTPINEGSGCFSLGCFLWGHTLFSYLSLCTMWTAIFVLIPYKVITASAHVLSADPEDEAMASMAHKVLGGFAMAFFHVNQLLGWWRPLDSFARNVYILIHVILGYGSKVLGVLAVFFTTLDLWTVIVWILLAECANILMYLVASVVQMKIDREIKPDPPRRYWPVPEGIDTENGDNFWSQLRTWVLGLHFLLQMVCFIIFWIVYWYWPSSNTSET